MRGYTFNDGRNIWPKWYEDRYHCPTVELWLERQMSSKGEVHFLPKSVLRVFNQ